MAGPQTTSFSFEALISSEITQITDSLRAASMDPRSPSLSESPLTPKTITQTARPTRQELLYQKARQTAGLAPKLPSIKEAHSLDHLPLQGRRGSAADFKPMDWLNKSAAILPEAYISSSPVAIPSSPMRRTASQGPLDLNFQRSVSLGPDAVLPLTPLADLLHNTTSIDSLASEVWMPPPTYPDLWSPQAVMPSPVGLGIYRSVSTVPSTGFAPYPQQRPLAHASVTDLLNFRAHRSMSAPSSPVLSPAVSRTQAPSSPMASSGTPGTEDKKEVCSNCGVTETVLWRLSKITSLVVCNACGMLL